MKRIDRVLEFVKSEYESTGAGVTATQVAEALSCWPNDASADLNRLYERGDVEKQGKKPVYYSPAQTVDERDASVSVDDPFALVVGANGSMKAQVQLAKAAITYPPHGLHTLISGNSGVGKTLFAETMWKYAKSIGAFGGKDVPFVTFNCAEYSDNPQLLLATLFGYARGAFTGAVGEKEGIVEAADGGVLFLDEVHRLPPTGQEMLFVLIDKKQFRRLGETRDRTAELMIICATTEEPSSALLTTFKRRIPVQINLPDLDERPLRERVEMVEFCFTREAARLQTPIFIAGKALRRFVNGRYRANVGDLKNAVQLACANALLRERLDSYRTIDVLCIDTYDIMQPFVNESSEVARLNPLLKNEVFKEGMMIQPGQQREGAVLAAEDESGQDIFDFLATRVGQYQELSLAPEDIAYLLAQDIETYCENEISMLLSDTWQERDALESTLSSEVIEAAGWLIARAGRYFDKDFFTATSTALARHLQGVRRQRRATLNLDAGSLLRLDQIVQERYPDEVAFLGELQPQLERRLGAMLHDQDLTILAVYLGIANNLTVTTYAVIVVGFGVGSASGTARFVNTLLSTHHIYAVDVTSSMTEPDIIAAIEALLAKIVPVKGALILSDMGAVSNDEQKLRRLTGVECIVLPSVSTELVMEAGRLTLDPENSLAQIAERVAQRFYSYVRSAFNRFDLERADDALAKRGAGQDVIIVLCTTGVGTAERAKNILMENVRRAHEFTVVCASAVDGFDDAMATYGDRVKLIISNLPVQLKHTIPVLPLDRLFMEENLHLIDTLLGQIQRFDEAQSWDEDGLGITTRGHARQLIARQLPNLAPHLIGRDAIGAVERLVDEFDRGYFDGAMPIDLYTSLFIHCLCMFDRAEEGEEVQMPQISERERARCERRIPSLLRMLRDTASELGIFEVAEAEAYYFLLSFRQAIDAGAS